MEIFAIIMAGGEGTRFWPLSRQRRPKHLLNIGGGDIMVNETIKRLSGVIPPDNILVITGKKQSQDMRRKILSDLPPENIIVEPEGKNTSACIAYAAMVVRSRCDGGIMCILPSDHHITGTESFRNVLKTACAVAHKTGKLITIGIKPVFPSSGYGYIKYLKERMPYKNVYEVEEFIEKPSVDAARRYVEENCYLWNSGMFVWKVSAILENLQRYLPGLFNRMMEIREFIGTEKEEEAVGSAYAALQNISIDYAVLERSDDMLVIPGDFGWNDVGSWDTLDTILPTDENGNIVRGRHLGIDTKNSVIYGEGRLIATIGLEDFIVADTDDALLICPRERAQEVKKLVDHLKNRHMDEYI